MGRSPGWLAFLRGADLVLCNPPSSNQTDNFDWFYPGRWFGRRDPVPTVELARLRRSEQDYEYLWLAQQRGWRQQALLLSRLLTRPVELRPKMQPESAYGLLCVSPDETAWDEALRLLAKVILPIDEAGQRALAVNLEEWRAPLDHAILLPRTLTWQAEAADSSLIGATLGVDVYNASDRSVGGNDPSAMGFSDGSDAWQFSQSLQALAAIPSGRIERAAISAEYDTAKLPQPPGAAADVRPVELAFKDGFTGRTWISSVALPVATCRRRQVRPAIDGVLDDWDVSEAIQYGPMVKYLDAASIGQRQIARAQTGTRLYTGWSNENLFVAFQTEGVRMPDSSAFRNFVDAPRDVASSGSPREDLCEILIQPVYPDNSSGSLLEHSHINRSAC
jgi:hypothetical protein